MEAAHYKLRTTQQEKKTEKDNKKEAEGGNRTISLIEQFLDTIPEDKKEEENKERKRSASPHLPTLPSTMWPICLILKATQTTHSSPS